MIMNEEIMTIQGVECYEVDGTAYLKLEAVARGLGFTTVAASGNEAIRWNTVHKYLTDLGVATSCNGSNYREGCPEFIPENIFYRMAMKARNETAERFQALIADEIIPAIRKHGAYVAPQAQVPATLDAAALQAFIGALDTLTGMVQTIAQRLDAMEQAPKALPALAGEDDPFAERPVSVKPPSNKMRRKWMSTASDKLNALSDKCGLPSSSVLHRLYQELEEEQGVILNEVRLKALEEHQLTDCSILLAIFYDAPLRKWFEKRVDNYHYNEHH